MSLRAPEEKNPAGDNEPEPVINGYRRQEDSIYPTCIALATKIDKFLESEAETKLLRDVQEQTRTALGVIGECLERYSLDEISLSYNGGKDCLVLLILLLCALAKQPRSSLPKALHTVYIISKHPFPEVGAFVDESVNDYKLDLVRYSLPMKEAFKVYLEDHRKIRAVLVGTRRTDPHGENLTGFDETDSGWPKFMRVHPVIDWHYAEIWAFIRYFKIPYCPLYDQGYTSLGGTTDTHPNPALKSALKTNTGNETKDGDDTKQTFRPAYELIEDEAERLGRDW